MAQYKFVCLLFGITTNILEKSEINGPLKYCCWLGLGPTTKHQRWFLTTEANDGSTQSYLSIEWSYLSQHQS